MTRACCDRGAFLPWPAEKGRGYLPAESASDKMHGVTQVGHQPPLSYRLNALAELLPSGPSAQQDDPGTDLFASC